MTAGRLGGRAPAIAPPVAVTVAPLTERAHLRLCRAEDPLVGAIAQEYINDREKHDKTAAEWTRRYAQYVAQPQRKGLRSWCAQRSLATRPTHALSGCVTLSSWLRN